MFVRSIPGRKFAVHSHSESPIGTVIIMGAETPTGLTTARALRWLPVRVVGVFNSNDSPSAASNHWSWLVVTPAAPGDQLQVLLSMARNGDLAAGAILLFSQDSHVLASLKVLPELEKYFIVPLPRPDNVRVMMDKTLFHQWAIKNRIDVPVSAILEKKIVEEGTELIDDIPADLRFPCILKPLVRQSEWDKRYPHNKFFFLPDRSALTHALLERGLFEVSERYLLQQWIPGGDADVYFVLFAFDCEGRLLFESEGKKLWQWPALGGSTAACELVDHPDLRVKARSIATSLGMRGLGSVEFKRDPSTGQFYVTEPTVGRNDYQSGILNSGRENPTSALVRSILGLEEPLPQLGGSRKTLWVDGLSVLRYIRQSGVSAGLVTLTSKLARNRRLQLLYFSISDIRPFLKHVKYFLMKRYRK